MPVGRNLIFKKVWGKEKISLTFFEENIIIVLLTCPYLTTPTKTMNEFINLQKLPSVREGGENECRGSKLKKVNPSKMR